MQENDGQYSDISEPKQPALEGPPPMMSLAMVQPRPQVAYTSVLPSVQENDGQHLDISNDNLLLYHRKITKLPKYHLG
jgi:hypothetical protein